MRNHPAAALSDTLRQTGLITHFDDALKAIESSKLRLVEELLALIEALDETKRGSWRAIIIATGDAGISDDEILQELGTSLSTLYRWRTEDVAPREGTRRLMKAAILQLIRKRREELASS